jgi:hypothetical protein
VDEELCKICFATATEELLANKPNSKDSAHHFASKGVFLKEMTEKGMLHSCMITTEMDRAKSMLK